MHLTIHIKIKKSIYDMLYDFTMSTSRLDLI